MHGLLGWYIDYVTFCVDLCVVPFLQNFRLRLIDFLPSSCWTGFTVATWKKMCKSGKRKFCWRQQQSAQLKRLDLIKKPKSVVTIDKFKLYKSNIEITEIITCGDGNMPTFFLDNCSWRNVTALCNLCLLSKTWFKTTLLKFKLRQQNQNDVFKGLT